MGNQQIWIKACEEQEYHELMDILTLALEEIVNNGLGFKHIQQYKIIKGIGHRRGRRANREEIGGGYVIMEALRNLRRKTYEDLKEWGPWPGNSEGYSYVIGLLKPEQEEIMMRREKNLSFEEWLKTRGRENTWQAFKEYKAECSQPKKQEWVKKGNSEN